VTSSVRRFPPDCLDPKIHHCNLIQSILAKIQANQAGADDALMLDVRGFVAETNATHVFLVEEAIRRQGCGGRSKARDCGCDADMRRMPGGNYAGGGNRALCCRMGSSASSGM
jgi:hypothetical protein